MANLPPIPPSYLPIFESYWLQLEGSSSGDVNAITAAAFLKKSQLKESLLHKIWDLSDPVGKGYLDKQGFFVALRLVSACQCGREPSLKSIQAIDPPPKFVGVEQSAWSIDANERSMYNSRFERLQPLNGLLSGEKVRNFLMQSQLPVDTLGKIWSLSDLDRDGSLDADEFAIALKLTSMAQKGEVIPLVLPQSLVPPTKAARLGLAPPAAVSSSLAARTPSPIQGRSGSDWVVTPDVKAKYDTYFAGIDKDHDGIVSGDEAKNLFMSSNLPHNTLAHIWRLCDLDNNGKLNKEQFALAMYLIAEKVKGREVPSELAPNMIPPSKRKGGGGVATTQPGGTGSLLTPSVTSSTPSSSTSSSNQFQSMPAALIPAATSIAAAAAAKTTAPTMTASSLSSSLSASSLPSSLGGGAILQPSTSLSSLGSGILQPTTSQSGFGGSPLLGNKVLTPVVSSSQPGFSADFSAIRNLDTVSNEIEAVKKEKEQLQQDIMIKKESLVRGKEEVGRVQGELEETTRQNQQLEQQKKELQSHVDEITHQRNKLEGEIIELKQKCQREKEEIEQLKEQYKEQETKKTQQTEELSHLQQQFQDLKQEEESLKSKIMASHQDLLRLQNENQSVQQSLDQVKTQIDEYRTQQQQLTAQLAALPGPSGESMNLPSMRISELPTDLPRPNLLSEPDAVSARATAGSSSPVSSISGFSTASHLEDQSEERDRTDTITSANASDPFASFPDPFTGAVASGNPLIGSDFSFDPFGLGSFKNPANTSSGTPSSNEFANFSAFSSNFSSSSSPSLTAAATAAASTSANTSFASFPSLTPSNGAAITSTAAVADPFGSGSDPFSSDPFASVTTPKASDQSSTSTGWGVSPFSSTDPFAQTTSTKSDPFFSTDPFGSGTDPFGEVNPFDSGTGGANVDPFATLGSNPPSSAAGSSKTS